MSTLHHDDVKPLWGVQWHQEGPNPQRRLIYRQAPNGMHLPALFATREKARNWKRDKYGYISRERPEHIRAPKVVKVLVRVEVVE